MIELMQIWCKHKMDNTCHTLTFIQGHILFTHQFDKLMTIIKCVIHKKVSNILLLLIMIKCDLTLEN